MEMAFAHNLQRFWDALRHPSKVARFARREFREAFLWNSYYAALRDPKAKGGVPSDPAIFDEIRRKLKESSLCLRDLRADIAGFNRYLNDAQYCRFPKYYVGGSAPLFLEKALEHYLAASLLGLDRQDVFIDVAAGDSPAAQIYQELYGCTVYRQDLSFPRGVRGSVIGGDAASLPFETGFVTKMALHCSFEHFEGDSDFRFIREAGRVLRRGGRLCILPLYLYKEYAIQTDPMTMPKGGIDFADDAVLYVAKGYRNRHGRFYSVPKLVSRITNNLQDLKLTLYVVQNEKEVDPSCYVKFIALFEKN